MAPLTRMRATVPGCVPNALNARYYAQRATPGGLIVAEASQDDPGGRTAPRPPRRPRRPRRSPRSDAAPEPPMSAPRTLFDKIWQRHVVADRNFGCGSSREHAVTTLVDNGFLAFVAPSFGDIFHNHCFQNGALPVRLPEARVTALRAALNARPGATMTVDLVRQVVVGPDGVEDRFETEPFRRDCLLNGVDDIGLTLRHLPQIEAFEARRRTEPDWA
jgi:hypothetical protein